MLYYLEKKKFVSYLLIVADDSKNIIYSNWIQVTTTSEDGTSNKTVLEEFVESYNKFLATLSEDLWDLTEYHFIAENQKNFLSDSKKQLNVDTCLIMMDFSEKYAFIAQYSTQGF